MLRFITDTFHRFIDNVSLSHYRYLYPHFNLRNRLTGIIGPRGVGKTTLLLQYIKNELFHEGKCFYFSADLIYFQQTTLLGNRSRGQKEKAIALCFADWAMAFSF